MSIDGKMKSESFKQKILNCIRAWEDWAIYPNDYLVNLQNIFLGLLNQNQNQTKSENKNTSSQQQNLSEEEDFDGKPLEDEDAEDDNDSIDGKPCNYLVEISSFYENFFCYEFC